ncbi:universal stress protein [Rubrivirga sp. IMCC43871]|uniref:universal stress protein n=1 Tax=Rubrivirga sp. IMCC43871 TaxID=3391575 RepID=UPI0039900AA2
MLPRHILCPTDFSPSAKRAVRYAARLAEASRARLELLHVSGPAPGGAGPDGACAARERLETLADEIGAWGVEVTATLAGPPDTAARLREAAGRADLVVAAARDGDGELLRLGGLVATLARDAESPVLLVGPGGGRISKGFHVLVPVDLSEASAAALREARALAASLGGSVDVVHAVPCPTEAALWGGEPIDMGEEDRLQRVERFVEAAGGADVRVTVRLAEGPPRDAVARVVGQIRPGLVVTARRDRPGSTLRVPS